MGAIGKAMGVSIFCSYGFRKEFDFLVKNGRIN